MRSRRLASLLLTLAATTAADAQVKFDGSIGKQQFSQLTTSPYSVQLIDGKISGKNGFLSFSQFDLPKNSELEFIGSQNVQNIIARVTSNKPSKIEGAIESPQAGVNLFLINPAGIKFGRSATLNVGGSFVASTADYVRFADGTKFSTHLTVSPSLSSALPSAFGFLGPHVPAAIHVGEGSASLPKLQVNSGQVLSLIGGAIQISHGQVLAQGGRVNLISAGGAGEAVLDAANPKSPVKTTSNGAPITLDGGAVVSADLGGSVVIRGGSLSMNEAFVVTDTDVVRGGNVDIAVDDAFEMTDSRIDIGTTGTADAGSLRIAAGSVAMHGFNFSQFTTPLTVAIGAESTSSGNGGSVDIESRGDITIDHHASISSSANASGSGGAITLHSGHIITINGNAGGAPLTGLLAETVSPFNGAGNAGRIRIVSPRFDLFSEGQVTSRTKGPGNAGLIRVDVDQLLIDGQETAPAIFTGLEARVGDQNGGAQGRGGKIVINSDGITLRRGGVITASTFGRGDAGGMRIRTGSLNIDGSSGHEFTGLFARTTKPTDAGHGGGIAVTADSLRIDGPGTISASSDQSTGDAGGVRIHVTGPIALSEGGSIDVRSDLANAGQLVINGDSRISLNNGRINASAAKDGGDIEVTAGNYLALSHRSTVSGKAGGNGGHITLTAPVVADSNSLVNGLARGTPVRVRIAQSADLFTSNATFLGADIITPPPYDLAGQLVNLVSSLSAPTARIIELCGQRIGSDLSSFVVVGKNGVSPTPESPRPSQ